MALKKSLPGREIINQSSTAGEQSVLGPGEIDPPRNDDKQEVEILATRFGNTSLGNPDDIAFFGKSRLVGQSSQ